MNSLKALCLNQKVLFIFSLIFLSLITFLTFFSSLSNHFTHWDDMDYVVNNPFIREINLNNLKTIFTSRFVAIYCPLTVTSFALEYYFFNLNPFYYHLNNVLLHVLNTLLVFIFIRLLSRKNLVAFLTALFFSIHPMKVEVVAWISARKDLLSTPFFLLALIAYILYLNKNDKKFYFFMTIFFIVGLFAKPSLIVLPFVLILIDYYKGSFLLKESLLKKIPLIITAFIFAIINALAQSEEGGAFTLQDILMLRENFLIAVRGISFYLLKTFIPLNLCAFYPYPKIIGLFQFEFLIPTIILCALIFFFFTLRNGALYYRFGLLFFLFTIALVIKLIPVGDTAAADRYMYIPSIGILYIFCELIYWLVNRYQHVAVKIALSVFLTLSVFFLSHLSFNQCKIWKTTETLFQDVLDKHSDIYVAHLNLGFFYQEKNQIDKAIQHYIKADRIKPDTKDVLNNMGTCYMRLGQNKEAIPFFQKILKKDPKDYPALYNLGNIYGSEKDFKKAIHYLKKTIESNPDFIKAYYKLRDCYKIVRDEKNYRKINRLIEGKN